MPRAKRQQLRLVRVGDWLRGGEDDLDRPAAEVDGSDGGRLGGGVVGAEQVVDKLLCPTMQSASLSLCCARREPRHSLSPGNPVCTSRARVNRASSAQMLCER